MSKFPECEPEERSTGVSDAGCLCVCSSVELCGSREQTGLLCGAEQHVGTRSAAPSGHTAAAAPLQLTRSLSAGFNQTLLSMLSGNESCSGLSFHWD